MDKSTKEFDDLINEMEIILDSHSKEMDKFDRKSDNNKIKSAQAFYEKVNKFKQEIKKVRLKFAESSLHEAFYIWKAGIEPSIYKDLGEFLVREMFIVLCDKSNRPLSIKSSESIDHTKILNKIRCTRTFSILLKENLILAYLSFFNWLSVITDSLTPFVEDPDEIRRQGRIIPYFMFIRFLCELNEKEQVVAKLLYYGGSRTLEEILSLNLRDIDLNKGLIEFGSQLISYPQHIFSDIKALTGTRTTGKVFKGRQNAPLNPATIFRNFKEAAIKVGLGQSFSPKLLTTNV